MNSPKTWTGRSIGVLALSALLGFALSLALTSRSVVWADPLAQDPPPSQRWAAAIGNVIGVDDAVLTVDTARGQLDVQTDAATRLVIAGFGEADLAEILVGDRVIVLGTRSLDGGRPYARIVIKIPDDRSHGTILMGTLSGITDDTLSLELRSQDTVQIDADLDTRVIVPDLEDATIDSLEAGDKVTVRAVRRDDGSLYALTIRVRHASRRGVVLGRIMRINKPYLTLNTRRGPIKVLTDDRTRFLLPGLSEPGQRGHLSNLAVGKIIAAAGTWEEPGTLRARIVVARRRWNPPLPASSTEARSARERW